MADQKWVLAGDIGGTKTQLALFAVEGQRLRLDAPQRFLSKQYSGLVPLLHDYLTGARPPLAAACFGIAGAVVDGKVTTPNLPWIVDAADVRRALQLEAVTLLNDLEAAAYGIFTLDDDEFALLNHGTMRHAGNKALIAAGTGLGQTMLYDDGHHFRPLASEGGHGDLLRAIEDCLVQRFAHREVSMDVLNLHRGVIDEDADGQRKAAERHHVDRISERTQQSDRGED